MKLSRKRNSFTILLLVLTIFNCSAYIQDSDSILLKKIREKYFFYKNKKIKKETIIYADSIVLILKKVNNKNNELASAYNSLGFSYLSNSEPEKAYFFYKKATEIYFVLKDSFKIAKNLRALSTIESDLGLSYKSDSTALKALTYIKPQNQKLLSALYNCLGINHKRRYDYLEAIYWYEKALANTKKENKIFRYKNNIANCYRELKEYKKSLVIYEKIINSNYLKKLPNVTRARLLDNYAFTKWLNDDDVSVLDFQVPLDIRKKEKDYKGMSASYSHLLDFFKKKGELNKAKDYALEMLSVARKTKSRKEVQEALTKLLLFKTEKQQAYYKEFLTLTSELEKERVISQNKSITKIYRVNEISHKAQKFEKKALKNKLLAEQQKSQKQLWIFIVLATFLGFIVYFFYKRNKTKKEKIIEVYKTETRLAKKIHDELANDLYLAMHKLQKGNSKDTSVLYDLDKIYSLTRNISHENSPVVTGQQFEDFLKQLLLEFSVDTCRVMSKGLSEVHVNTLAKEKQIVLYRLVQELLVNMKKHSKANLVVLSFSIQKGLMQIKYKDNGIGVENIKIKNGLQNMETRIKSIGGTIIFESENQKGFQAKFQFKK